MFSIVTLTFLTLFLLIGLPDFKRAALNMLPPREAERVGRVLDEVTQDDLLLAARATSRSR